jgi:hypothetical protein
VGNISDIRDSQQNKCALLGAKLAVFEMVHHGVTSLLEVEEMNAIHLDFKKPIIINKM